MTYPEKFGWSVFFLIVWGFGFVSMFVAALSPEEYAKQNVFAALFTVIIMTTLLLLALSWRWVYIQGKLSKK